jgi:hypothetical protein
MMGVPNPNRRSKQGITRKVRIYKKYHSVCGFAFRGLIKNLRICNSGMRQKICGFAIFGLSLPTNLCKLQTIIYNANDTR